VCVVERLQCYSGQRLRYILGCLPDEILVCGTRLWLGCRTCAFFSAVCTYRTLSWLSWVTTSVSLAQCERSTPFYLCHVCIANISDLSLLKKISPVVISTFFKPFPRIPSTSLAQLPSSLARAHLARSITSDLGIVRASIFLDIVSHTLVGLHVSSSPLFFTGVTSISALAAGSMPALQSLAICILQRSRQGSPEIGALFGGLSMLTALGQILGVSPFFITHPLICSDSPMPCLLNLQPLMFGIVYSTTVARFPEAVFALAAALVLVAFVTTSFIRTEAPHVRKGKAPAVAPRRPVLIPERERGRSRTVKHIGDRLRKPPPANTPTPNHVSVGPSASTASSSRVGLGDEAV
jgi:hypothetical protein